MTEKFKIAKARLVLKLTMYVASGIINTFFRDRSTASCRLSQTVCALSHRVERGIETDHL